MDISFLFGPAVIGSRVLGGSNVTLNGQTSLSTNFGYGYQVARLSAASFWVEVSTGPFVINALGTASIPGSVNNDFQAYTAGVRVMVPIQSRVSLYGAAGGGGGSFQYVEVVEGASPHVSNHYTHHGVFEAGGGVDVRLTRRLSVRGEVRDFVTGAGLSGANGRNHVLPMFGVAFHF